MRCALVFDLDGTLIDSAPDLHQSVNRMLAELGLPAIGLAEVTSMVGDGAAKLLARALVKAGAPGRDAAPLMPRFLAIYETCVADLTRPYPGVPETLAGLRDRGHRLAICTNKPDGPTQTILDALGLTGFFDAIVGANAAPARKPDARHLLAALAPIGAAAEDAVMIGDGANDLLVAQAAGVPAILARYGYGLREPVDIRPAATIDRFAALPEALAAIARRDAAQ